MKDKKRNIAKITTKYDRRRFIKLICYIFGLAMAWGWRDAIKYLIYAMFTSSELGNTIAVLWIYVIIVECGVTLFNTLSRGIRGLDKSHFGKYFDFDEIKNRSYENKRWLLYSVWYKNLQVVVGLAWYDGIVGTSCTIAGSDTTLLLILLWSGIVILVFCSVTLQFYWKKYWFGFEILRKGLLKAYYDTVDEVTDHTGELDGQLHTNHGSTVGYGSFTGININTANVDDETDNKNNIAIDQHDGGAEETESSAMLGGSKNERLDVGVDVNVNVNVGIENSSMSNLILSKKETFWFLFWKEFVDLLIYAWSIGGSYSVYAALS